MNAAVTGTSQTQQTTQWQIDPAHSAAHFSVRHLMISNVRGEFGKIGGTVTLDSSDLTKSHVEISIDTASIDTREPQRDEHLRSGDFFDVVTHPAITFRSTKITSTGSDRFKVTGDLTIKGVSHEATFDVEGPTSAIKDPWGNTRTGVTASTKINRKDFGLGWNALLEGGGVVVGEEVSITFDGELIQKAD
jgi:polyisoprenoid-binding protein YceI